MIDNFKTWRIKRLKILSISNIDIRNLINNIQTNVWKCESFVLILYVHNSFPSLATRRHPRWQDRWSFDPGRSRWKKNKIYVFFSSCFLSRILVLCSPALWNSIDLIDRSDDEEDGWGKREKGCNEAIERMIISISILVILLSSKISPTLTLKNYCYALKNYPSFPSRIDI